MANTKKTASIFALFRTQEEAERAIDELAQAGFGADEIGVLVPGDTEEPDYFRRAMAGTGAGTALGGAAGAVLGAASVGAIPGIGPVLVAGALVPVLMGAITGGSTGGLFGWLFSMSSAQDQALYYTQEVRSGRSLVTVTTDRIEEARRAFEAAAALEVAGVGRSETADKMAKDRPLNADES